MAIQQSLNSSDIVAQTYHCSKVRVCLLFTCRLCNNRDNVDTRNVNFRRDIVPRQAQLSECTAGKHRSLSQSNWSTFIHSYYTNMDRRKSNRRRRTKLELEFGIPAKHANRMDARAHTSTLAECAPRFMTPRSQGFVGQSSPNLAHV